VAREFRGQGLGRRFYRLCEDWILGNYLICLDEWTSNDCPFLPPLTSDNIDSTQWVCALTVFVCHTISEGSDRFFLKLGFHQTEEDELEKSVWYGDDGYHEGWRWNERRCFQEGGDDCFQIISLPDEEGKVMCEDEEGDSVMCDKIDEKEKESKKRKREEEPGHHVDTKSSIQL